MVTTQLMQGDCLELMKAIPDASVDMVLCDPPYGIAYKTGRRKDKAHRFCSEIINDGDLGQIEAAIPDIVRVLRKDSACYLFASPETANELETYVNRGGLILRNRIVWDKGNTTAGDLTHNFGRQYEVILFATKGKPKLREKRWNDIWFFPRVAGKNQYHQNEKPVPLLERMIKSSSDARDLILDPFMGSGSTGVACVNTGRNFIGIELDPGYFEIAKRRIDEANAQVTMEDILKERR